MSDDLARMDATAQAELVSSGEATPLELLDAAIERMDKVNPELNAIIHDLTEDARTAAQGDVPDGPFKGVPFLLKDLGAVLAGQPLHMGSTLLKEAGFRAPMDSFLGQRFRDAGLITFGKTNTPEFGIVATTESKAYGPCRNPWNTERTPGGSSGGSAAAVAAGIVPMAHANDGGGSIRIPASNCGLVGLKPTRQRISEGPMIGDNMGGMTVELCVSRSVRDTARLLDAVHGAAPGDPYVAPQPQRPYVEELTDESTGLRIGMMSRAAVDLEVEQPCVDAVSAAAKLIESLGHSVEDKSFLDLIPEGGDGPDIGDSFLTRWAAGQAATLGTFSMLLGREITADDVEAAHLGTCSDRPRARRRPLPDGRRPPSRSQPDDRRVVRIGLRPAADTDDGRGAAADRGDRHLVGQSPGRLHALPAIGCVHGAVQRHRPAGNLAAAALDRRGPPGRRTACCTVRA